MSSALVLVLLAAAPEVSLDDALALALLHNAELKVTRAEVEVAQASVPLAHDWEMPKLRAQLNDAENLPTGTFTWYAGLAWRPPNPWEWKHGGDAAEAKLLEARFELAASSWRVVKDVRLAWLDVSGAAAHERLAKESVVSRGKLLSVLRRRLEQGGGTQVEVNLAQLGETDARQDLLRWQGTGLKAAQSVAWLVGQSVKPIPATLPDAPPLLPDLGALEKRLDVQPRLEALRAKVRSTEAQQRNLGAKRLPWPEVQVRFRQRRDDAPINNDFQVGLTVPLGVTPAPQLDVARAVTLRAQAQLDAEKAQLLAELQILFARAQGLRDRWLTFQQDYLAALESHRALQGRVMAEGSLDPTVLLAADRLAIDMEHKRLEVQLDLARTLVELEGVAGPP
jgi:outer membrane protein TolC